MLWPYVKCAKNAGKNAYFAVDKAVIDGNSYSYDKIEDIPAIYKPSHTKSVDDTVLFFTKNSPLSNFYKCSFKVDDVTYTSVEQYYTLKAALFFKDETTCKLPMHQTEAVEHKRAFKRIKDFDKATWYQHHALKTLKDAMYAKFSQNDELGQFLKNTQHKNIAEANPSDWFWGTGVSMWSKNADQKNMWKGENNTGKLLMEVRGMI